uniref:Retrotransposon gag domain-containing protein n=1 Tax=Fagus sylvatica TaxID=28930 RepID=A0A2N9GAR0_FAGSY
MEIETRAGVPAGVLDEGLQTQIDEHSGAFEQLYTKFDRIEAKLDNGFDNLQAMMRELLQKAARGGATSCATGGGATKARGPKPNQPRVEVQMGEGMENGQNRPILGDFGDPIEERRNEGNNARFMPQFQGHFDAPYEEPWLGMRQGRQQGQQGQQAQLEPILGDFGDPIEERRNVGNNARFMPQFQGHFDAPYEEPWLGMRQGRQQGQQGQQALLEPILGDFEYWHEKRLPRQQPQGQQAQPQRHASQAREPRNAPWPQGDVVEPWYDHGGGKGNWGRARNYQGPQDRDPYGKNQDPLQRQQGRQAREPRAMELEFPRFKGGDPTSWMFRAIQYFEYYQVHDASKVMHASYHLDDDALIWFQSCEHDLGCWDNFARAIQLRWLPKLFLKVAVQGDPKVAECDPKVAAQIVPKVAAQIDPKVTAQLDPKPTSAKPTMMVQKLTPKQMLERRRKGLCYYCDESWTMWHTCKAMKLYLIEEVQEEEGAYVTSYEEEERVEWCEERRNTKEESINKDIQVPSRYWLIGRSPLMKKHLTKKQLEDSSSIRPQQDHNLEDKVFRWEGQC